VLFLIGMELDLREIKSLGKPILSAGILQITITTILGASLAKVLGFGPVESWYLGVGLAFSSTILVVKLLIDNQNPPAFNLAPLPPEFGDKALAASVKELSRLKYGRDRAIVEQEILQRIRLAAGRPPVAPPTL
ncbi:MAG: Kef-type K+ transport system predicted NAD-binding component-like protein, partial [Parcubacteria group bacterium GW2011_GWF2_45_11]